MKLALYLSLTICSSVLLVAQATPTLQNPHLFAPGEINTADFAFNASFTPDGNTVYFSKSDPVYSRITIVLAHKKNGHWSVPEVASFSGVWKDTDPFVSPDGKRLFFISNRPADAASQIPRKDYDIWYVEKTSAGAWGEAVRLGPTINTDGVESYPSVTRDGTIYFGSMRPEHPGMHIYRAHVVNGQYGEAELLPFAEKGNDIDPTIAADESFIVFSSRDRGGEGEGDVFVSFHSGDNWSKPRNLGPQINSASHEIATALSPDNRTLYFASNRMDAQLPRPKRITYAELEGELHAIDNGMMKIYEVDISGIEKLKDDK